MDVLPEELVGLLFTFLNDDDKTSLRLTCKIYAKIGEEYLFNNFEFVLYPQLKRLAQLEVLSQHATIAKRVRSVSFVSGVLLEYADYRYWRAVTYQDESGRFSRGITSDGISHIEYEKFHANLDGRFFEGMDEKYDAYRYFLDEQADECAKKSRSVSIMSKAIVALENIESVSIKMQEPQITLKSLEDWCATCPDAGRDVLTTSRMAPRARVQRRRNGVLSHFANFLEAVKLSSRAVKVLRATDLPREVLFFINSEHQRVFQSFFADLQQIQLDISEFPLSDWLSRGAALYDRGRDSAAIAFVGLINQAQSLQSLVLSFPIEKDAEFSYEIFDHTNVDKFPKTWLRSLKKLSLTNFHCRYEDLTQLLCGSQIKDLTLRNGDIETGSMIDIIHLLRMVELEKVDIGGIWNVKEDDGNWHSHTREDFTECTSRTSYEGPYVEKGLRYAIENFVLYGGDCPLPSWTGPDDKVTSRLWELRSDTSFHFCEGFSMRMIV